MRMKLERLGRELRQGLDVDLILGLLDGARDRLRGELEPVGATDPERLVPHPNQCRLELIGNLRRVCSIGDHVTAAAVDLVL
jgi:hypothetical protein